MKATMETVRKVVKDDPRRVIHAVKVGLAVTLVSLFYYSQTLYKGFGSSTIWAVLTVVVVFEYSVGATLGKGLNRAMATLVGGALGIGAHGLASHCGYIGQPFLIGVFIFIQASAATFMRFFPKIKARYDYGFMISILTFSLISISGLRVSEVLEMARERLGTILIGVLGTVVISVFVFPVWAGEDLHNSIANNLDKLGTSLEGFGIACFKMQEEEDAAENLNLLSVIQAYKTVLNTKHTEESLANFARWEPRHGHFRHRHPWRQYLILGSHIRECAFKIDALNAHLNPRTGKTPLKLRHEIHDECNRMISEASKALKGLASALKAMKQPSSSCKGHVTKSKTGVKNLKNILKSTSLHEDFELLQIVPVATAASLLTDIVNCTDKIAECVHELALLARFEPKKLEKLQSLPKKVDHMLELEKTGSFQSTSGEKKDEKNLKRDEIVNSDHVVITIDAGEQVTDNLCHIHA